MTILQAAKHLSVQLAGLYDAREVATITDMVMEKITGLTNTQRLINKHVVLTIEQKDQLGIFLSQLLQHMPVQYILNEAWFAGLKFYVDENVLIPRPETEELVEIVVAGIKSSTQKNLSIVDIGTGSGCIAISLKRKLPDLQVLALEISDTALVVAQKNARENNVEIQFIQADILRWEQHATFPRLDIIVSNPPYIRRTEAREMSENVLLYEPHHALFVPDNDALLFYKAIADFALQNLQSAGKLFLEINEAMGRAVAALLIEKGFSNVNVKKDMQDKERIVTAVLNEQGNLN